MSSPPPAITLCTLNAKYIHASLGLRYLLANMGDLQAQTRLREFTISRKAQDVVDALWQDRPAIIGFGVYIWNVVQTCAVIALLKAQYPHIKIVLGGPEVSHELEGQEIVRLADHVITGWGDISFPKLCKALLLGPQPLMKVMAGEQPPLEQIQLPYALYTDDDLAHRVVYVEASRGCPFKCEFCLSSLDKTAWAFDQDRFLNALDTLVRRGARSFKFVDRTFNLKIEASVKVLQFFLDRLKTLARLDAQNSNLFLHFEVIPDHLPDRLKEMIAQFPPGVLQFEIGIQSLNVQVQQRISRRQDNVKTLANLQWLRQHCHAHLHTDLIFGLPGEDWQSFSNGFDVLYAQRPHEIQLGLLKRLRGTPIGRHSAEFGLVFDAAPPYALQQSHLVGAAPMQQFVRLARYWDLLANSGRFGQTLLLLLERPVGEVGKVGEDGTGYSAFHAFWRFSEWLWQHTQLTSGLTPENLVDGLFAYLTGARQLAAAEVLVALRADYLQSGAKGSPNCLRRSPMPASSSGAVLQEDRRRRTPVKMIQPHQRNQRQLQHLGQKTA